MQKGLMKTEAGSATGAIDRSVMQPQRTFIGVFTSPWLLTLCVIPMVMVLLLILRFGADSPYMDEWALVELFEKVRSGTAQLSDFLRPHNEHRIVLPKLILVALAFSSNWNQKLCMLFSLGEAIALWFCLVKLMLLSGYRPQSRVDQLILVVSTALVFSLAQWENWLWGFQLAWFLVNLMLVIALLLLMSPDATSPRNPRFWGAAALCFLASISLAQGMLFWIALLPVVAFYDRLRLRRPAVWLGLFGLNLWLYNLGYSKPGYHPSLLSFMDHPRAALSYFLNYVGGSLGDQIFPTAVWGAVASTIALGLMGLSIFSSSPRVRRYALPWISLGLYGVLFGLLVMLGRSGFGVEQALASRYTSVSIFIFLAIAQMLRLQLSQLSNTAESYPRLSRYFSTLTGRAVVWCTVFLLAIAYLLQSFQSIALAEGFFTNRGQGFFCSQMAQYFSPASYTTPNGACLRLSFPNPAATVGFLNSLQELEFIQSLPPVNFVRNPEQTYGFVERISLIEKQDVLPAASPQLNLQIKGWAAVPEEQGSPDLVFISQTAPETGDPQFVATANVSSERRDVAESLSDRSFLDSGWSTNVLNVSRQSADTLEAWVYVESKNAFVRLRQVRR